MATRRLLESSFRVCPPRRGLASSFGGCRTLVEVRVPVIGALPHHRSVGRTVVNDPGIADRDMPRTPARRAVRLTAGQWKGWSMRGSLVALALALSLTTGCSALGLDATPEKKPPFAVDPATPFVVVTVGGVPAATPTAGVAEPIPDSTPLPRIDPPAASAARPAASPSLNRSAAARVATQQGAAPGASPVPAGAVP